MKVTKLRSPDGTISGVVMRFESHVLSPEAVPLIQALLREAGFFEPVPGRPPGEDRAMDIAPEPVGSPSPGTQPTIEIEMEGDDRLILTANSDFGKRRLAEWYEFLKQADNLTFGVVEYRKALVIHAG